MCTIYCSCRLLEGVSAQWGVCPGGVWPGRCLPIGVSAQEGCVSQHALMQTHHPTPPWRWTEWLTDRRKTIPFRNFVWIICLLLFLHENIKIRKLKTEDRSENWNQWLHVFLDCLVISSIQKLLFFWRKTAWKWKRIGHLWRLTPPSEKSWSWIWSTEGP